MKYVIVFLFSNLIYISYGQIIADHTVVDKFDDIPQYYLNEVKKMRLAIAGESHGLAYARGLVQLEILNPLFDINYIYEPGSPEEFTNQHLRVDLYSWGDLDNNSGWIWGYGEEDWFTSVTAINRTKAGITYCHDNNLDMVYGLVLCYDGGVLDATDYLNATQIYLDYCIASGYNTRIFFSTGAIDDLNGQPDERGYLKYKLYEDIRNYVKADASRILFDYADILYYNDNSTEQNLVTWNGHTFPVITEKNSIPAQAGHISAYGELRLAKAMWWMLARIAGWEGGAASIPVAGITLNSQDGVNTISSDNGQLQLTTTILPVNASNKTVTWSIQNGTGQASISSSGLVTAISNGTVTAKATANDGSGVFGTFAITISNQAIAITDISVSGEAGATTISADNGTLQLTATVSPVDATNKTVTWSIQNGTGQASISTSGLVTAIANGTVTARATANDGSGVYGTLLITISNQIVQVSGITVTGAGGSTSIAMNDGTLQLNASIIPDYATNKTVTWSLQNGTGQASISTSGLVTAIANGTVTARATANDGSNAYGTLTLTLSNQIISVTSIVVSGAGGANSISTDNGQLQLTASVSPTDATNKSVTWEVQNGTGQASISTSGLVTAIANGTVTARATANDGSGVYGTFVITISNQVITVAGISVTGAGGINSILTDNGTLQLTATVNPADATDKTVTWSVQNGIGQASISPSGLVTAIADGTVTARATANDGSGVYGTLAITISSQVIAVTGISVSGDGGINTIQTDNGTLQLSVIISPVNATDKTVTWSVLNGTGQASISPSGLVTAITDGTVTARAAANDGSGVYGTLLITISNQVVPVSGISVISENGSTVITDAGGCLQLIASISPVDATNQSISWSVFSGSGQAQISNSGLLTALADGWVTVRAGAEDGSGVYGTLTVSIYNQKVLIASIVVYSDDLITVIDSVNGTLHLQANIYPANATEQQIIWTVENITGSGVINAEGLLTAQSPGEIRVRATSTDGSDVSGILNITIQNGATKSNDDSMVDKINITQSAEYITIHFPNKEKYTNISIISMAGNVIIRDKIEGFQFDINKNSLLSGVYLIQIYNREKIKVLRMAVR